MIKERNNYIKVYGRENAKKVRSFCDENNIEVYITEDPLDYLTEQIINVFMEEDNNKLKKLFKEIEEKDDTVYARIHDRTFDYIDNIIDEEFDSIKNFFNSEVEEELKYFKKER